MKALRGEKFEGGSFNPALIFLGPLFGDLGHGCR
jgi:hypothetical protein